MSVEKIHDFTSLSGAKIRRLQHLVEIHKDSDEKPATKIAEAMGRWDRDNFRYSVFITDAGACTSCSNSLVFRINGDGRSVFIHPDVESLLDQEKTEANHLRYRVGQAEKSLQEVTATKNEVEARESELKKTLEDLEKKFETQKSELELVKAELENTKAHYEAKLQQAGTNVSTELQVQRALNHQLQDVVDALTGRQKRQREDENQQGPPPPAYHPNAAPPVPGNGTVASAASPTAATATSTTSTAQAPIPQGINPGGNQWTALPDGGYFYQNQDGSRYYHNHQHPPQPSGYYQPPPAAPPAPPAANSSTSGSALKREGKK